MGAIDAVEQVTFSGPFAAARGRPVLYNTERCVVALRQEGLELIEIAPGIDIDRDILAQMDFKPLIPATPAEMDARIFHEATMDLREDMLRLPLDPRLFSSKGMVYLGLAGGQLRRGPLRANGILYQGIS